MEITLNRNHFEIRAILKISQLLITADTQLISQENSKAPFGILSIQSKYIYLFHP